MKNRGLSSITLLLLVICYTLSACVSTSSTLSKSGIEKRRYTKGYTIDLRNKQSVNEARVPLKAITGLTGLTGRTAQSGPTSEAGEADGALTAIAPLKRIKRQLAPINAVVCGDEITFRTGERVMARVISVGIQEVTYKRCDNIDGPSYVVNKSEVFMIEYINGSKDVFDAQADEEYFVQGGYEEEKATATVERYSIVSLVMGITSFFMPIGIILGILGIIFGRKALMRIANSEGTLKGEGMARTGIILGIVNVALTILILALVIAILF